MPKDSHREVCYHCYRPQSSCMCSFIHPVDTRTHFVLLMHPKEFKKTKNGTGHFTHLSLHNSALHIGINFTDHPVINTLINDPENCCYVLYPGEESLVLNETKIGEKGKRMVIFLIDATWPCSKAMLKASPNLDALPKVSFVHQKISGFHFKKQPQSYCLSTMESTLCLLKLLQEQHLESLGENALQHFLLPFEKMVGYQLSCEKH